MIETQSQALVDNILTGNAEKLSEQDKATLIEHKEEIIKYLVSILSKEVPFLTQKGACLDITALFWGLELACFLEASEAFSWLQKICRIPIEILDDYFGFDFVTEELPYLLANTTHSQWQLLKTEIEDPSLDEYIRSACLHTLVLLVGKEKVERSEIIQYFKELFQQILTDELNDPTFPTHLVDCCTDLWPGECLEEIREIFGLDLIDETFICLDAVLEEFAQDKEFCIEKIKNRLTHHTFLEKFSDIDEDLSKVWIKLLLALEQIDTKLDQPPKKLQRNELCFCGSGRKYKKCCMNKPSATQSLRLEATNISYKPLEPSDEMKAVPESDRKKILDLYYLNQDNPEKVPEIALMYLKKYPNLPMLYNYLYVAYRKLYQPHDAMKILRETLQRFPDYLFARVEYALYLLRRGEPEKAHAALNNAHSLLQLYPERKIFHVSELKAFSHVMSLYFIQKNDLKQATTYLEILREISPNLPEIEAIEQKMRSKFSNFTF